MAWHCLVTIAVPGLRRGDIPRAQPCGERKANSDGGSGGPVKLISSSLQTELSLGARPLACWSQEAPSLGLATGSSGGGTANLHVPGTGQPHRREAGQTFPEAESGEALHGCSSRNY